MIIYEKLADFNLKIKHAYSLYNLIGEEDQKEIENELKKKKEEEARKAEMEKNNVNNILAGGNEPRRRKKKFYIFY